MRTACTADGLLAAISRGGLERPRQKPVARDHPVHQPDPRREFGIDEAAGQQQVHRVNMPDLCASFTVAPPNG